MPTKGSRSKRGKKLRTTSSPADTEPEILQPEPTPEGPGTKRKKTVTSFTEEQKEEIIEFLIQNQVLYSKRLAGFKDVAKKEDIWAAQAAKMNANVEQLKTWYSSMRTMMGRLKKRAKKSGSGGDVQNDDMNSTEKWVWDKFSFLIPHIETVEPRNVCSFTAATASGSEPSSSTKHSSTDSSRVSTPVPESNAPAVSQPGSDGCQRGREERMSSVEMKELLVEFMSRSTAYSGSSYFGRYVEDALSKLPGEIRREAEVNIMQELHRAQREAQSNPEKNQDDHMRVYSCQQPLQQKQWQPPPSQWPVRPVGPQTSVWGSQDREYVQRQFPAIPITCNPPSTKLPIEPMKSTTVSTATCTTPVPVSTTEQSFVTLLSTELNTPGAAHEDDETAILHA